MFVLIKRFVEPGVLPRGIVADFDAAKNLLRIDRAFYDATDKATQRRLWRAKETIAVD